MTTMSNYKEKTTQTEEKIIKVKRTSEDAYIPTRATGESAGLDIRSCEDTTIKAKSMGLVRTGICAEIPKGCYARIASRSSTTVENWIQVGAGVIDGDYRGEIKVVLFNLGSEDFQIKKGNKIAQLICEKIELPRVVEVQRLCPTERGNRGFGSSGQK